MTGQHYVKGRVKCEATNFARLAELIDESKYQNRNMKCLLFVNKILLRGRTTICNSYFDNVMTKFMINNKDRHMQNRQIESKKTTTEIIDVTRRKERYFAHQFFLRTAIITRCTKMHCRYLKVSKLFASNEVLQNIQNLKPYYPLPLPRFTIILPHPNIEQLLRA